MAVPTKPIPPEDAILFGEEIRDLRPVSQAQFAEGRGFSSEWLSKLESGRTLKVSITKLAALSVALGFPKDALSRRIDGEPLPTMDDADLADRIRRLEQVVAEQARQLEEIRQVQLGLLKDPPA